MDRIRYFAQLSVLRALGFAGLGLVTTVFGVSFDPHLALQMAAVLLGIVGVVLTAKSLNAPRRNYRHTELWILLGRSIEFPEHRAQQILGTVLKETYGRYARPVLVAALCAWLMSLLYAAAFPDSSGLAG